MHTSTFHQIFTDLIKRKGINHEKYYCTIPAPNLSVCSVNVSLASCVSFLECKVLNVILCCAPGDATVRFQSFGLKPASSIKGRPTLVKMLPAGTKIGYGCTYETAGDEWVATFPVGYADGYWRHLSTAWFVVRDLTGEFGTVLSYVWKNYTLVYVHQDIKACISDKDL